MLTTLTKEFFVPRFVERDEGEREAPCAKYPWDGVSGVRPFHEIRGDHDGGCILRAEHDWLKRTRPMGKPSIVGDVINFRGFVYREVKQFVSRHRMKAGDRVEIVRIAPFEYRIRPAK